MMWCVVLAQVVPENGPQPADSQGSLYTAHTQESGLPTVCGYEVVTELGRGTNAVCFLAKEVASKRLVALKVRASMLDASFFGGCTVGLANMMRNTLSV